MERVAIIRKLEKREESIRLLFRLACRFPALVLVCFAVAQNNVCVQEVFLYCIERDTKRELSLQIFTKCKIRQTEKKAK